MGVVLGWRQIASPDIGFHLSTARWMIENRAWPATDSFSFTFPTHVYIDLQWLFQLVLHGVHRLGGPPLLIVMKIALTLGFWALLVVRTRRTAGSLPWSVPVLLMLVALGDYSEERPHLFSWLYGSAVLLILEEFSRGNRRWLAALPAIQLLWVNTHQMFVLGLVITGVYAAWELRKGTAADRRLIVCALLSVLASFINPYFLKGFLLPLTLLAEIQPDQAFASPTLGFSEVQAAFTTSLYYLAGRFVLFQPPLYWHIYTLLVIAGLIAARRTTSFPTIVLSVLFAIAFAQALKNFGYFVLVTFPVTAIGLERAVAWVRSRSFLRVQAVAAVALIALVVSGQIYRVSWDYRQPSATLSSRALPVEAAQFINDHNLRGNVLTTVNHGGYVHWATRQPVSAYSLEEVIGLDFYHQYLDSLTPQGFPAFLDRWKPTIAVVSVIDSPFWLFHLSAQPAWRLVQFTDSTALFLHASVPGPAAVPDPRPGVDFPVHPRDRVRQVITETNERPEMTFGAWLDGIEAFQQPKLRLSTLYLYTGQLAASISAAVDGLAASPIRVSEQLLVLGTALNASGDYELADLAFAGVLKSNPDAQTRQQIDAAVAARSKR